MGVVQQGICSSVSILVVIGGKTCALSLLFPPRPSMSAELLPTGLAAYEKSYHNVTLPTDQPTSQRAREPARPAPILPASQPTSERASQTIFHNISSWAHPIHTSLLFNLSLQYYFYVGAATLRKKKKESLQTCTYERDIRWSSVDQTYVQLCREFLKYSLLFSSISPIPLSSISFWRGAQLKSIESTCTVSTPYLLSVIQIPCRMTCKASLNLKFC